MSPGAAQAWWEEKAAQVISLQGGSADWQVCRYSRLPQRQPTSVVTPSGTSAEDNFEIVLKGVGGHAARPHWGNEVLVAACATVMNLQTIVSRRLSPTDIGVVSVTELITDGTRNALPGLARILGDARSASSLRGPP